MLSAVFVVFKKLQSSYKFVKTFTNAIK